MYTIEEVEKSSLNYFRGDQLAAHVWQKKYALKDKKGAVLELNPDEMHRRLAIEYARIESHYINPMSEEEIYELLKDFTYLVPGGSQLSGIGNHHIFTSLSNCFVIESSVDSYGGIFKADEEQVQIMKRRGGVGHDISSLRPSGSLANNVTLKGMAGTTLYMDRFSNSTREVSQGDRRGALMLSISCKHPDAGRFIDIKLEEGKVTGANISVKVDNEFMKAVEADADYIQTFPIDLDLTGHGGFNGYLDSGLIPYDELIQLESNSYPEFKGCSAKRIKARELWYKIVKNAWKSAEPGLLFWDNIISESPARGYGEEWAEKSTNPCGEIPLCPYDSCRLLALNLYSYVVNPFTSRAFFNMTLFKEHVYKAQRIMDDLIDLELEKIHKIIRKIETDPEDQDVKDREEKLWWKILQKAHQGRRTGLGITAEGDMLAALGFKYGTPEATEFSTSVHEIMAVESYKSSIDMAKERGAFPMWEMSKDELGGSGFLSRIAGKLPIEYMNRWVKYGRRNLANLTIAPTGTLSLMTQTTSGVESLFEPYYLRRRKTSDEKVDFIDENGDRWEEYRVIHPKFVEWYRVKLEENYSDFQVWYDGISFEFEHVEQFLKEIDKGLIDLLFEHSPYYGATSNDVDWRESVKMQGSIQKWIDHSISKTINLPKTATEEQVDELYRTAFESGCKGVTVYRDGSRNGVLIKEKPEEENPNKFKYTNAYKRPEVVECDIYRKTALKKDWMLIIGLVDGIPFEMFAFTDPGNHKFPIKIEKGKVTKVRSRVYKLEGFLGNKKYTINNVVDLMEDGDETRKYSLMLRHGIHPIHIIEQIEEYVTIVSLDKVIMKTLRNYVDNDKLKKEPCPVCGSELRREEGCIKCVSCEYSKCG